MLTECRRIQTGRLQCWVGLHTDNCWYWCGYSGFSHVLDHSKMEREASRDSKFSCIRSSTLAISFVKTGLQLL